MIARKHESVGLPALRPVQGSFGDLPTVDIGTSVTTALFENPML